MGANSSAWRPIEEMGVYKAYIRLAKEPAIRWIGRGMTSEERFEAERRAKLLNKPIEDMGIYLANKKFGSKWRREQQEMREMRANGATYEQIALEMQCHASVVRSRLAGGWKE